MISGCCNFYQLTMDAYFFRQDHHVILLILPLIILSSLLLLMRRRNAAGRRKLPPGPFRLPLVGNLHQLRGLPQYSFRTLSAKYGPLMLLQLGSVPTLVVSSADVARQIFESHDIVFSGRPALYAGKKLSYSCLDITFSPYGVYWREIRKIAVVQLLGVQKVQSFETVRKEEVERVMDLISSSSDGLIDLSDILLHLMKNIICRVAFGRKFDAVNRENDFHTLLHDIQKLLGGFIVADFFPWLGWIHKLDGLDEKLAKAFGQMDKFFDEVIQEHHDPERPKAEVEDLVDVMLRVQADHTQKISLGNNSIKAILMDIFVAGTDTSAATLVWTMTELIRRPTLMKKAQEELGEVIGKEEFVEESDLPQMKYLKFVVKETMRLHPPVPLLVPRETTEACTIQGYNIPAKTRVFVNAKSIATDPGIWKNPEQFLPERFLDNSIDFKGLDYEFIPFGVGRRGCPGTNFAVVLVELVLANLLHCFNWELPPGLETGDVDMKEAFGLTMHKEVPLCLIARKRQTV